MTNKSVFITGATGGIGQATAIAFANKGYRVAVGYNSSADKANTVIKSLTGSGHIAIQCTVDKTDSIKKAKAIIQNEFGTLDALINNAGFTKFVPHDNLQDLTDDLVDGIFQTHCRGSFACIREMEDLFNTDSCIVQITSLAGETGMGSNIAYCAAKSAMDTMTKSLARALSPKIRVMAVAPGLVDTDFVKGIDTAWRDAQENATPQKRLALPEEIANAVLACVDTLTFSTGRTIYVDGGRALGTL